jgi:hypothetical protein
LGGCGLVGYFGTRVLIGWRVQSMDELIVQLGSGNQYWIRILIADRWMSNVEWV